ncbi:elongation factor G [Schlesneria paludicola]|uniref:elongation factor G n=1 Tax=Schlesneria paludicola TaxID=360056 RepID=UPI00029AA899|nr:elongation factor G [Schlesneria paludicola]
MATDIQQIRNIGIIAHIDAGKTTTTERILFYAGATHRMGDVDAGTTVTDFDPEEAARGITIYSAAISCKWQGHVVNIIDTPGHVDFTAEVERSLRVLDGGVVVFSAVEGVEAQSETVWRQADHYRVPRVCFINKMDRIGAGFERVFGQIENRLHANPVALQLPIGEGPVDRPNGFCGVIDLIEMKALYFSRENQGREIRVEPIPEAEVDRAQEWRARLIDAIALLDDDAFAIFDETGDLPPDQVIRVLRKAVITCQLQPVLCGASLDYVGVQPILDAVIRYLPSPDDLPPVKGRNPNPKKDKEEVRKPSDKEPFCGLVFKIHIDEHTELCFIRIYSGVLKSRSRLLNPRTGGKELVSQLWRIQADSREKLEEASAGDIVGVVGPKESVTGDTLCDPLNPILLESIEFPESVISMAIEPESSADRKKLEEVLTLMAKQDPTFSRNSSEETGQTIISGMGELHLEIISKRIERDFKLKIRTHRPRVTYRESVRSAAEAESRIERQVGGANQFAAVKIRIEPDPKSAAVTVVNQLKPGDLPEALQVTLVRSLQEQLGGSGAVGFPLHDIKLTILGVGWREGETTEAALQYAAAMAFRQTLEKAGTVLLEPIMKLEVVTPDGFVGNVSADLNSRRAMIVNTELRNNLVVIDAEAPLATMFGYSNDVRSLSQGRASYSMEPLRFDEAPARVLEEMLG